MKKAIAMVLALAVAVSGVTLQAEAAKTETADGRLIGIAWYIDSDRNVQGSLSLQGLPQLSFFDCRGNKLTSLDVSNCKVLTELNCADNQLSSLDISNSTALTSLACDSNVIVTGKPEGLMN